MANSFKIFSLVISLTQISLIMNIILANKIAATFFLLPAGNLLHRSSDIIERVDPEYEYLQKLINEHPEDADEPLFMENIDNGLCECKVEYEYATASKVLEQIELVGAEILRSYNAGREDLKEQLKIIVNQEL